MTIQESPIQSIARVQVPGGWVQQRVAFGGHTLRLSVPADPDEVLTRAAEADDDGRGESDPYWAMLWPASRTMAKVILGSRWTAGTRTLELGCGTGLVGLAALAAGLDVTLSDYSPPAVAVARENARRNGFPAARCVVLDWRDPPVERFPLILASDVLYDADCHLALLGCLDCLLDVGGACWIGDPGRHLVPSFLDRARDRGYAVHLSDESGNEIPEPLGGRFQLIELEVDANHAVRP